jgi:hypothetical protein
LSASNFGWIANHKLSLFLKQAPEYIAWIGPFQEALDALGAGDATPSLKTGSGSGVT